MLFKKIGRPQFKGTLSNDIPENVKDNTIYVVGEKSFKWVAVFRCPCGCRELIQLNLLEGGESTWRVTIHRNKFVTIRPSIWRTAGCKSHFTIKRGYLNWVHEYPYVGNFSDGKD